MAIKQEYKQDIEEILSHRHDNGWDYFTTEDKRLLKGGALSMIGCVEYLLELGMSPNEPILKECTQLLFEAWKEDGRFKMYPKGTIFPCETAHAASTLCELGYVNDPRIQKTMEHFLTTQYKDQGWWCKKFYFGKGPETEFANPYPTLKILNIFRHSHYLNKEPILDNSVEFLLWHWEIKKPIGPCHYGIGTLFQQVGYPFTDYNLFEYLYVLSFYNKAKKDPRFLEALALLQSKLVENQIVVERVSPKLKHLNFCKKGEPSELATKRYRKILINLSE